MRDTALDCFEEMASEKKQTLWPHAPVHRLSSRGAYFLTAGTYRKEHFFRSADRLRVLHRGVLTVARNAGWQLEAWAVFSNHYHFVGHSPPTDDNAESLSKMLSLLHEKTAKWINKLDGSIGRQVWHNFWDTKLTYEKSYFARLKYVHLNPVKHGLVSVATAYPWCSAGWFERTARPAQVKTIYSLRIDKINVYDEYEVAPEW
ncbi:MAG TPA: transposase [Pyrinomonadaceae bacterium]|nr:transposase [Pyrinomonadaceae bacterium]